MLIPGGGFGWVIGGRTLPRAGTSECVLSIGYDSDADRLGDRTSRTHRCRVVTAPGDQAWATPGAFADPDGHVWMVTSAPLAG